MAYGVNGKGHDLHPKIMGTCSQVHSECQNILYGENVFQVPIREFHDQCGLFKICHEHFSATGELRRFPFWKMQRIEILINEMPSSRNGLAGAGRTAVRFLSGLNQLQQVSIIFRPIDDEEDDDPWDLYPSVLHGFSMIRNVKSVDVEGIAPNRANLLIEKMTRSSPVPKMYFALEFYAGSLECCKNELQSAYWAAEKDDVDEFMLQRQKVIDAVTRHMADAQDRLLEHDPSSEWILKSRRSSSRQS